MTADFRSYCPNCLHAFEGSPEHCQNLACRRTRPRGGWLRLLGEGDILDRNFLIQGLIAVGGAGVTYRAQEIDDHGQPRPPVLAIKVLHSRRARGAFLQRLANEARILQNLRHDHIVECMGFSQRKGTAPYLVTRFERGGTLEDWARDLGPLPAWTVAGVLRQIFEGLTAAHAKGVVHRDLKPANLLLARATQANQIPHVRIADFGIAKVTGKLNEGLTRVGAFIGTPRYAAPEQFSGAPATAATDVFAGGVLAYELLTAEPLLQEPDGGDLEDWRDAMLAALPPTLPAAIQRDPRAAQLQALLQGTLQADPVARWDTAQVIGTLDHVLGIRAEAPIWNPRGTASGDRVPREDPSGEAVAATKSKERPAPEGTPRPDRPPAAAATSVDGAGSDLASHAGSEAITEPGTRPAPVRPRPPQPRVASRVPRKAPPPPPPAKQHSLVPRRRTAEVLGDHPGAPWVTEAARDQSGGADLEQLVPSNAANKTVSPDRAQRTGETDWRTPPLVPITVSSSTLPVWEPSAPFPLPARLPGPPTELLGLLAAVSPADRSPVARALAGVPATVLDQCIRNHRPGNDPLVGRGVALAIAVLRRREWETVARQLLADPDLGVRVAAATALGRVAEDVRSLESLQRLLADSSRAVQIAAVRALAAVAVQTGRQRVATFALRPLANDSDPGVQDAVECALADLE